MAPISLLEHNIDLQNNNDPVFRAPWSSNQEVDLKVIGQQHMSIGKRNSTPIRFGAAMPFKTNPLQNGHVQQQQIPYTGAIPGPLVGNHFSSNATNPQMINGPITETVQQPQHRRLDRSLSEPARNVTISQQTQIQIQQQLQLPPPPQVQPNLPPQVQPPQSPSSRYKTELCRPFAETGFCKYGEKCQFAHGGVDLRSMSRHPKYKTELCRTFHTTGLCGYGTRCHFIHNADERRSPGEDGTNSPPISQTSNSPPQHTPSSMSRSGAIQQRMMYLQKTLQQELQGGPSPPLSFNGSPTESSAFFDETFNILQDYFPTDTALPLEIYQFPSDSKHHPPQPAQQLASIQHGQIPHQNTTIKEEIPPLIGMESPPDSPTNSLVGDSLIGDMDNLSISPESNSPPPDYTTSLNLRIENFNKMLMPGPNSPPLEHYSQNQNQYLDQFDCSQYFRLPIFETLTEV